MSPLAQRACKLSASGPALTSSSALKSHVSPHQTLSFLGACRVPATLPAPQVPSRKERTTLLGRTRWCRLVRNYDIPLYPKNEEIRCQQRSLGQEDPLEKGMATHSSILAWRIPRTEELRGLQSMVLQKSWTQLSVHIHTHSTEQYWRRC